MSVVMNSKDAPKRFDDRVVLFLDILGFKKHVEETVDKENNDLPERIATLHRALSKMGETALNYGIGDKRQVTQFSDSIVISFNIVDKALVVDTFKVCLKIWVELLMDRIICRGALSSGKLIHTDQILFGPALLDAYETESEAAMYPRIIMDRSLYRYGRAYNEGDKIVFPEHLSDFISLDHDGKYYLNFLHGARHIINDKENLKQYFETLREVIIYGSRYQKPSLKVKYGYLKYKYNDFLNDFRGMPLNAIQSMYGDTLAQYFLDISYLKPY